MTKKRTPVEPQVRMSLEPDQFALINQAAKTKGLNVTAFCRMAAIERAREELEKNESVG